MNTNELLIRIDERQRDIQTRLTALETKVDSIDSYVQRWKWSASLLLGLGAFAGWVFSFWPKIGKVL